MCRSKCDYTIFFRELAKAAECSSPEDALSAIEISFYGFTESGSPSSTNIDSDSWIAWFKKYLYRIQVRFIITHKYSCHAHTFPVPRHLISHVVPSLGIFFIGKNDARDPHERRAEQNKANPKYVLR